MRDLIYMLEEAVVWGGAALAALAPLIVLIELVELALYGEWPGWSVEAGLLFVGLDEPRAHFSTVQFLLDVPTDLPLAIGMYLAGLLICITSFEVLPEHS